MSREFAWIEALAKLEAALRSGTCKAVCAYCGRDVHPREYVCPKKAEAEAFNEAHR